MVKRFQIRHCQDAKARAASSHKRILTTKEFGSGGHFSRFLEALGVGEARYTVRSKGQALCMDEEAPSIQRVPHKQQHPPENRGNNPLGFHSLVAHADVASGICPRPSSL